MSGGKFISGFLAAGFTQATSSYFPGLYAQGKGINFRNTAIAAVVGGTASVIGGGKFANGAVTGAFSRMYNDDGCASLDCVGEVQDRFNSPGKGFVWDAKNKQWRSPGSVGAAHGIYAEPSAPYTRAEKAHFLDVMSIEAGAINAKVDRHYLKRIVAYSF